MNRCRSQTQRTAAIVKGTGCVLEWLVGDSTALAPWQMKTQGGSAQTANFPSFGINVASKEVVSTDALEMVLRREVDVGIAVLSEAHTDLQVRPLFGMA